MFVLPIRRPSDTWGRGSCCALMALGFREELMPETWLLRIEEPREEPRVGALRPLEGNLALHRRQSPSKTGHKTQKLGKRTGLIGEPLLLYQPFELLLLRSVKLLRSVVGAFSHSAG